MSLSPKSAGRKMPYTPAYAYAPNTDPEKGLAGPTRLAKKLLVTRKARLWIGALLAAGVVLYLLDFGGSRLVPSASTETSGQWEGLHEDEEETLEMEYDGDGDQGPDGDRWESTDRPLAHKQPSTGSSSGSGSGSGSVFQGSQTMEYIVDSNGDHYITNWQQPIAPMHPDISLLTPASDLLTDIDPLLSEAPISTPFPSIRLREIVFDPEQAEAGGHFHKEAGNKMPADAWSQSWTPPDGWDEKGNKLRKVQWAGFKGARSREGWESREQKQVREERKEAVKRGFRHAWEAYKRHAWGHDEVKPVSQSPSDPFNGWGATIVDSLDTLLLMGFSDEYNLCRPHINQLNYHWVNGRDWSAPFVSAPDEKGESYAIARDKAVALPIFETGIRYLGGMLGAYDLSGDQLLVDRAVDLAEVLGKAFNTESGLPGGRVDPGSPDEYFRLSTVSIAEVGSMSLELIRLAQVTQDRKWFDLAQRAMDYLEERVIPRGVHQPLIPMWFQPNSPLNQAMHGGITFGGLADSYYEYLIKTYKLLGGNEIAQKWKDIYARSIDKAKELIYVDINVVPQHDLMAIGKLEGGRLIPELEHLSCFAGAMLGLGAKLLDRKGDMSDAERVTKSCYWLSADTPTGLQPEVMEWYDPSLPHINNAYENVSIATGRPHVSAADLKAGNVPGTYRDRNGVVRWSDDKTALDLEEITAGGEPRQYALRLKGRPTGAVKVSGRGINRPETIESIFYMYRLTGDRKWQEKGWKMFVSWMETSRVAGGISSVADVTKPRDQVQFTDNMESFALAETFKYHFLLQSEPDVLSLDDYVLNTEAHPFLVNPALDPTDPTSPARFWTPQPDQELGDRAQGTDVQKFARLEVVTRASAPLRGPPPGVVAGGGKGMGGGGGAPGARPQPPPHVVKIKPGRGGGEGIVEM